MLSEHLSLFRYLYFVNLDSILCLFNFDLEENLKNWSPIAMIK